MSFSYSEIASGYLNLGMKADDMRMLHPTAFIPFQLALLADIVDALSPPISDAGMASICKKASSDDAGAAGRSHASPTPDGNRDADGDNGVLQRLPAIQTLEARLTESAISPSGSCFPLQ
jgi:hypothetical protein